MVIYRGWYYYNHHFCQNYLTCPSPAIHAVVTRHRATVCGIRIIWTCPSCPLGHSCWTAVQGPVRVRAKYSSSTNSSQIVYALEFFPAHEPEVLFFLRSSLTKMVHASRITRYLDNRSRHGVLRWTVRSWPGRASKDRCGLRLFDSRRKQFCWSSTKYSGRWGGLRSAYG